MRRGEDDEMKDIPGSIKIERKLHNTHERGEGTFKRNEQEIKRVIKIREQKEIMRKRAGRREGAEKDTNPQRKQKWG